ncbi:MAG: heat-inducible transcription repressor HrcA [Oscillospiraceae bacterium]|nr:heat-inducible transcription repressor HrcA [Oscillospiraceae bacterium]
MELTPRKKKILAAVIEEYIRTAEPVGSKAIAAKGNLGCSPATIRNELAELVSRGYLEQPHTSAGRVPTPLGYRMYVNELMETQDLSDEEVAEIAERLSGPLPPDQLMSDAGRIASQLTNYPALTITARPAATIRRFDLIYLDANSFIIVLLLSTDAVKNKLVRLPVSVDQTMIQKLSTLFNAHFTGISENAITPGMIHAAERAAEDNLGITAVIAAFAIETLTDSEQTQAYLVGETQLLNQPEFRDPDKAHRLMRYLTEGGHLADLPLEEMHGDNELRVLIGPENVAEELKDSSVIIATYDAGDNMRGIIGVVGPTRMDYSRVAAKLSYIAAGLSKRLGGGSSMPPPGLDNKLIIKGEDFDEREIKEEENEG